MSAAACEAVEIAIFSLRPKDTPLPMKSLEMVSVLSLPLHLVNPAMALESEKVFVTGTYQR